MRTFPHKTSHYTFQIWGAMSQEYTYFVRSKPATAAFADEGLARAAGRDVADPPTHHLGGCRPPINASNDPHHHLPLRVGRRRGTAIAMWHVPRILKGARGAEIAILGTDGHWQALFRR